ncbi:hypothetical protein ACVWYF_003944 [Hymenobacter sp. UYAg731]
MQGTFDKNNKASICELQMDALVPETELFIFSPRLP